MSLDLPTFGIAGKSVRVPFSIESSLPREFTTTVTMRASDGDEVTKEVKIARDDPDQRFPGLEAEERGRLHGHAVGSQARRGDLLPKTTS